MKPTRFYVTLFALFLLPTPPMQAQTTTTPATAKGTAIGQTINAAITAALPGVSAIGNILKALFPGSTDPTKTAKVTPNQVTAAVTTQAAELQKASQAQLATLSAAIAEIAAANDLASAAQIASESLGTARAFLTLPDGWDRFTSQWTNVAKPTLAKVATFDSTKFGKISNEDLVIDWTNLNHSYVQWTAEVDKFAADKNLVLTITSFDKLLTSVQGIATIPSVELKLIANQLATVKAQPNNGQTIGIAPPPPVPTSVSLSGLIKANS